MKSRASNPPVGEVDQPPAKVEKVELLEESMSREGFARSFYRHRLKPAIAQLRGLRPYDPQNTIVMVGSPRGGTTWLSQILATIPKSSLIWEPFDIDYTEELVALGFNWREYIPVGSERPEVIQFLERLLVGKIRNARINNASPISSILQADTFIVKSIRCQMLLHWMSDELAFLKPPIFLLRHPCAVVNSQLRFMDTWKNLKVPRFPSVLEHYPEFSEILDTIETMEEKLAALWALDIRVGLSGPKPLPFHIVTYESLVENGEAELHRLFDALGRHLPDKALQSLRRASATTASSSFVAQGKNPLEGWRAKLSKAQSDSILRVVNDFGIHFYDESLTPDEAALQRLVAPSSPATPAVLRAN